ncbi:MAG TPA: GNAT family N-acetyltransferase [Acidimicrobiales bacterium]
MGESPGIDGLGTARLLLRPITRDDVDLLVEIDRDPEVMRYLTGGKPSSRADVEATIARSIGHRWIASERAAGDAVGWVALRPTAPGEYELGYRLLREYWGRGLATEAGRALVAAAFDILDAQRVWAQTMAVNQRSRAVMERCGLRYVRTFHVDFDDPIPGTELGEVEYELRRNAWTGPTG